MASSSAALSALVLEVRCFFFISCSPDGDDPDAIAPHGAERRPHHLADSPDDLGTRFIQRAGRDLKPVGIAPQRPSAEEVYAVLLEIGCRLRRVELEVH